MAAGLMISAYGTLHTTMLTGPRVPFALARAGLLPAGLARISANGVPAVAILMIGLWSICFKCSRHIRYPYGYVHFRVVDFLRYERRGRYDTLTPRALAGIGLIVLGLPLYEYFRRRAGTVTPPFWHHDDKNHEE